MLTSLTLAVRSAMLLGLGSFLPVILGSCTDHAASQAQAIETSSDVETIYFGIYTADKASKVVERFAPVIAELEQAISTTLERPIRIGLEVSDEYEEGINNLTSGKVHFSRLGPASFITAKERNPELLLLAMESKDGKRTSSGIIAVHRDSPISSLAELKGKSFAFGDPLSTIGRYLSQAELLKVGIQSSDLADFKYLNRHDTVGMAVAAGDYDAGALKESTFNELVSTGHPIRELKRFANVTKPWVAHPSIKADIINALTKSLLELKCESVSQYGFVSAEEHYYQVIREAMASTQQF